MFKNFTELRAEIRARDYSDILGLIAEITEEDFNRFLEVLPPIYSPRGGFLLSEPLTHDDTGALCYWFREAGHKDNKKYYCSVTRRCEHMQKPDLIRAAML